MSPAIPPSIRLGRSQRRGRRGPRLTLGLVVGASAVVAATAAGVGLLVPPVSLGSGWVRGLRYVGLGIVLVGAVGLAFDRPSRPRTRGPDPTLAAFFAAALLMTLLALAALLAPRTPFDMGTSQRAATARAGMGPEGDAEAEAVPPPPPTGLADVTEGFGPDGVDLAPPSPSEAPSRTAPEETTAFDWGALGEVGDVLLAALIVGLVIAGRWAMKRRPDREVAPAPEEDAETAPDLATLLEASLDAQLLSGVPSRELITIAYRRMLQVLAAVGAAREPHEAPYEHLSRALAPLGIRSAPMKRLASLYVLAQFSDRPIEDAHRTDAASALRASLAEVRTRGGA